MSRKSDPHDAKRDEALKAIKRVEAESETVAGSTFVRMADRAKSHMSAADKDEDDRIEVWGTRIGRGLGLIFFVGLVIYLLVTYVLVK
ncbi:MAG: hypothetical protein JJ866_09875 [Roseibium sp.]|uniref:hypothetical protein n=1 Tax=Roseibium sp. TaxID=1936156 RepID=UPI001AFF4C5F|nr:hypothetical protein [Roseibium sp.]MBO6506938.1 hypothetical protein [Roseibium sp.]MBO6892238.1 hypothetical protein [Roseibium sp.]MBO6930231.1 hypothetical protein [Roseibium sp.]